MKQPFKDDVFQGFNETNRYFEGWYFKQVSSDGKTILSIIPGISKSKLDPHAFIQLFWVDHTNKKPSLKTDYVRFSIEQFQANPNVFEVTIGDNFFSKSYIRLSLRNHRIPVQGELRFQDTVSLPRTWYQPSIMGPFAYLPLMECYHGVVSMNHTIQGSLTIDQHVVQFDEGKGYIEKDYGRSFPSAYVWIQANHFTEPQASLFFSYATIPYLGLKFSGLICHWYFKGQHIRFATYDFSAIQEKFLSPNHVQYQLQRGSYRLLIDAQVHEVVSLPSPKDGQMNQTIKEGLSGRVKVSFFQGKKLQFEGQSEHAGIEIMKGKKHDS
jgi:hypothetical protein